MAKIEEEILIAAAPEIVYEYRLDFAANLSEYNKNVSDVVQIEGDRPGVGSRYRLRVRLARWLLLSSTLTVTEAGAPDRICDWAESRLASAQETVRFERRATADSGVGTHVTFVVETVPRSRVARSLDGLLSGMSRRQARLELESMRTILEGVDHT